MLIENQNVLLINTTVIQLFINYDYELSSKGLFLPPNTTYILQPVDHGILSIQIRYFIIFFIFLKTF